jgi:membrane fusion protein, heavy metal efflux system
VEAPSPSRRRRLALVAAVVVGLAALLFAVARGRGEARPEAPVRDVPRLEDGAIVFSAAFRERAGIELVTVERVPFRPTVEVVGTVSFNPSHLAAVGARLRGFVKRTLKFEGDAVKAGEALAEIDSAELGEAQASIAQVQARFEAAEIHAARERDLLERGLTTAREAEMANAELANQTAALQAVQQRARAFGAGKGAFGVFVLRSPIDGHVVERNISPGQSVDGSVIGYKVADLRHLWIELSVFERDLRFVSIGDDADVAPGEGPHIHGKVAHVGSVIDAATRSAPVRVAIDDPEAPLRVGQSVHAKLRSSAPERDAVLVPHEAVAYVDGKATLFVAESETRIRPVEVKLGASDGARHEVLEGLEPGSRVARSGVFALKSELFR